MGWGGVKGWREAEVVKGVQDPSGAEGGAGCWDGVAAVGGQTDVGEQFRTRGGHLAILFSQMLCTERCAECRWCQPLGD